LGRKRIYAKIIQDILNRHRSGSFTQIKIWIREEAGREVDDSTLSANLKFLIGSELVHTEVIHKKDSTPLRKHRVYSLTKEYTMQKLRSILEITMEEIKPVKLLGGTPWITPIFILGSEMEGNNKFMTGLFCAVFSRFKFEVERKIQKFNKLERDRIKLLLAKLLWISHTRMLEWLRELEENRRINFEDLEVFQKLRSPRNGEQLLEIMRKEPVLRLGIEDPIMHHFPRIHGMMPEYKWWILGEVIHRLDFEQLKDIEGSEKENIEFLTQTKNQKLLSKFIQEVNQIVFVLMVSVGYRRIDEILWDWILRHFEDWKISLRKGELDNREWIFKEGIRELEQVIKALKMGRRPPFRGFVDVDSWKRSTGRVELEKGRLWDIRYLYEHHPRGKSLDFFEEIYSMIAERRKQKMLNEHTENTEILDLDELF